MKISIHALLAESDTMMELYRPQVLISIHALLAESDAGILPHDGRKIIFLSTLSLRRATGKPGRSGQVRDNFYPRSPCGERQRDTVDRYMESIISIHALLAESDEKFGL